MRNERNDSDEELPACACGRRSAHVAWRPGYGEEHECCFCYVAHGNPPAKWHDGCMRAYAERKAVR